MAADPGSLAVPLIIDGCEYTNSHRHYLGCLLIASLLFCTAAPAAEPEPPITYTRMDGRLIRTSSRIAAVAPLDGAETVLAPEGVAKPWMVSLGTGGEAALTAPWNVKLFRSGKVVWDQRLRRAISAGPLLTEAAVVLGAGDGQVIALKKGDGSPLWKATLPGAVYGPIVRSGGMALVFCDDDESLHALDLADGKRRWSVAVGDRLKGPPRICGERILLVSKANRLLLVNPSDGAVVARKEWSSWLLDVGVVTQGGKTFVACTDLEDRITLLEAKGLKVRLQRRMPAPLSGQVLLAESIPLRWAAGSGKDAELGGGTDVARGAALVVTDREGYFYLVAMPKGR